MQNSSRFHGSDWSEIISFKQYTCTSSNKKWLTQWFGLATNSNRIALKQDAEDIINNVFWKRKTVFKGLNVCSYAPK